ncbi:mechanosensitive ion channel protein MscS [Tenacibaculum sp. SZ-18]|uniref:mechanosensitive ion channel family protein n=1 Tax=Tenacibaculum sp. SZ-18 TaxID=754423 RepID=UPI000C2D4E9C|nr:mechanosensitive ion channel domain-containing protein [Tenacibaculum sp. SZ-18]AUC14224.1 mechanosensitive ion channel protein MscS [Tenacibaculum sp. SZ-18]
MEQINKILNYSLRYNDHISISVKSLLILIVVILLVSFLLKLFRKYIQKKLREQDKNKFDTVFSFGKWLLYIIIFLITLQSSGVQITAIFAASTALLIGVGLALQTFFQDIISGIFIIMDQSVHVGDYIEIDKKIGRVEEIKLRTTRAVTIDNKVLIIPNHMYLKNSLYNWTQNGSVTKDYVSVGVAYGSDTQLVKTLLLQTANEHKSILSYPEPFVLFDEFGDSSLNFELVFSIHNSFQLAIIKSDLRFRIDELFRENNVTIPFPQRDVHIIGK